MNLSSKENRQPQGCACGDHMFFTCTRGHVALIDQQDKGIVEGRYWSTFAGKWKYPHRKTDKRTTLLLHREIMKPGPGQQVDHINGDAMDNRRRNLRLVNKAQNQMNRSRIVAKSGFKGVRPNHKRHMASIKFRVDGKVTVKYLGTYDTPEQAAAAYDEAAVQVFGEYARTNKSLGLI